MKRSLELVKRWVFPYVCCLCNEVSELPKDICQSCLISLPWFESESGCYRCGNLLKQESEHIICVHCQEKPPPFDRLCALFHYQPPLIKLITRLKFSGQLLSARILGELLTEALPKWYKKNDLPEALLPVPLSLKRLKKRGYNQALELMRPVLKKFKITPLFSTCKKIREISPQSGLNKAQRNRNLKAVYQIVDTNSLKNIEHIAILDDVVTTGSTVKAIAALLKEKGVPRVDVICCCRA